MLNLDQGKKLVELARKTVERWFKEKRFVVEKTDDDFLRERRGVFVTIENFPSKSLRGCIGNPSQTLSIYEAVQRSAFSSAFEDPRFPSLKNEELDKVVFEVSIMTKPELIQVKDPKEYFERIEIGKDGLVLVNGPFSSLFLPQVWELIPTTERFLQSLCLKAGLTENFWRDERTRIFRFRVQAFKETKPYGEVIEVSFE